jgi:hypothetical protein
MLAACDPITYTTAITWISMHMGSYPSFSRCYATIKHNAIVTQMIFVCATGFTAEALAVSPSSPDRPLGFENSVSEFTLRNGLHFIILERHVAPVVSCHIYANVGAFVEEEGSTGMMADGMLDTPQQSCHRSCTPSDFQDNEVEHQRTSLVYIKSKDLKPVPEHGVQSPGQRPVSLQH